MKILALVVASGISVSCLGQMTFESRLSVLDVWTRFGGGDDHTEYSGFAEYNNTITGPGAIASQRSSLSASSIVFSGAGHGSGSDGPGQQYSSGSSNLIVDFVVHNAVTWTLSGSSSVGFPGGFGFTLRDLATNQNVFSYSTTQSGDHSYSGSGTLAAGRYRYFAGGGGGPGFANGSGTLTIVPSPASLAAIGISALSLARRRR